MRTSLILLLFLCFWRHNEAGAQNEFYNDGSDVYVQASGLIYVQGEVINDDQLANVGRIYNSGDIQLTGNWTNTASSNVFQAADPGTTTFLGSGAVQTIGGTTDTYFNNLTINKPAGTLEVRQLRNSLCDGVLNLTNDFLNTQSFNFLVSNPNPAAITRTGPVIPNFTNSTTLGYVKSTPGSAGRLVRATSNLFPGAVYFYPVGDATLFRPVEITPTSVGNNLYAVQFVHIPTFSTASLGAGVMSVNPQWYHFIERAVAAGSPENIRIYWDTFTETICNPANMGMAEWNLSVWSSLSPTTTTVNSTPTLSFTQKTGYPGTYASPWVSNAFVLDDQVIAPWANPCPLDGEKIQLSAQANETAIELRWTSSTAAQAGSFELERSEDGIRFITMSDIHSSSGANASTLFHETDGRVYAGKRYFYRVVQHDLNGGIEISNIAQAILLQSGQNFVSEIFPNPSANGEAYVQVFTAKGGDLRIQYFDASGKNVSQMQYTATAGENLIRLEPGTLAKGVYAVIVSDGTFSFNRKLVVE